MKTRFLSLLCAFVSTAAYAEPLERVTLSGISLTVSNGVIKTVTTNQFKTNYGSSDIHTERERSAALFSA